MNEKMRKWLITYIVMLVLAYDEIYVADIVSKLNEVGFVVPEGTLYPLLNRLKTKKYVIYNRKESMQWPPRKYYTLSDLWQEELKKMTQERKAITASIHALHSKF